jgi:RimJ/RimL family protein N-acetyltransferase
VPTVRLVPFEESHLAPLQHILTDPELLRYTRIPVPVPEGFPRAWFDRYAAGRAQGTRMNFAILEGPEERFAGFAVAPEIDAEARTAELGYGLAPWARGRGIATEALRALTAWAFDELGMHRLELLIAVDNAASKRVARTCGYTLEGVLRSLHIKQDVRMDTEIWSRLATDG